MDKRSRLDIEHDIDHIMAFYRRGTVPLPPTEWTADVVLSPPPKKANRRSFASGAITGVLGSLWLTAFVTTALAMAPGTPSAAVEARAWLLRRTEDGTSTHGELVLLLMGLLGALALVGWGLTHTLESTQQRHANEP